MAQQAIFNDRYEFVKYLGQGSFGVVVSVKCRGTNDARAIKLVDTNDPSVLDEVKLHCDSKFIHENIVQYFGSWIVETGSLNPQWMASLAKKYPRRPPTLMVAIELELCQGDLYQVLLLRNKSHFAGKGVPDDTNKLLAQCLIQTANGLKFLHSLNVVHRDIKPANILLGLNGTWKISDLGLARLIETSMTPKTGTPNYLAPEQNDKHYNSKVDIFAFGLITFEICYPLKDYDHMKQCFKKLRKKPARFPDAKERLQNYAAGFEDLIRGMIKKSPVKRMEHDEIIKFFNENLK